MACGCNKTRNRSYVWTSDPDPETGLVTEVTKFTEVEAKALVLRHGGSYENVKRKTQ
jgi:hypothetical protein